MDSGVGFLDWNASSVRDYLCDLGQVTNLLYASIASCLNGNSNSTYHIELLYQWKGFKIFAFVYIAIRIVSVEFIVNIEYMLILFTMNFTMSQSKWHFWKLNYKQKSSMTRLVCKHIIMLLCMADFHNAWKF